MIPINPFRTIPNYKPLAKRRATPRRGRLHNPKYLEFIRSQRCLLCAKMPPWSLAGSRVMQNARVEAAHVGVRGLSQKASDRETIPLCAYHHTIGETSHHKMGKRFWQHHGLDRDKIVHELNERYDAQFLSSKVRSQE